MNPAQQEVVNERLIQIDNAVQRLSESLINLNEEAAKVEGRLDALLLEREQLML